MNLVWALSGGTRTPRHATRAIVARYRCAEAASESAAARRVRITRDLTRMKRHLLVTGIPELVRCLTAHLDRTCELLSAGAEQQVCVGAGDESRPTWWENAVNDALGTAADARLTREYTPQLQRLAARAHARTMLFLDASPTEPVVPYLPRDTRQSTAAAQARVAPSLNLLRRAEKLARGVSRLHVDLRPDLLGVCFGPEVERPSAGEFARLVRDRCAAVIERVPAIARRDGAHAVDAGVLEALSNAPRWFASA